MRTDSQIRFSVSTGHNRVVIQFVDSGDPFDPTGVRINDNILKQTRQPLHRGLGLTMIRRLTNQIAYERRGDQNIFTVEKTWGDNR